MSFKINPLLRKILVWLSLLFSAVLTLILLVVVSSFFGATFFIQSKKAQTLINTYLEHRTIKAKDFEIQMGKISGQWPEHFHVEYIEIRQAGKKLLNLKGATLKLKLNSIFSDVREFSELSADELHLESLPAPNKKQELNLIPSASPDKTKGPKTLSIPINLLLEKIELKKITFKKRELPISLEGRLFIGKNNVKLEGHVRERNGVDYTVDADGPYNSIQIFADGRDPHRRLFIDGELNLIKNSHWVDINVAFADLSHFSPSLEGPLDADIHGEFNKTGDESGTFELEIHSKPLELTLTGIKQGKITTLEYIEGKVHKLQEISTKLEGEIQIHGQGANGKSQVQINGQKIGTANFSCDNFESKSTIAFEDDKTFGSFWGKFFKRGTPFILESKFEKTKDTMRVRDFSAHVEGAALTGNLIWNPLQLEGEGRMDLKATSLEPLGVFANKLLRGASNGYFTLSKKGNDQLLDLNFAMADLEVNNAYFIKKGEMKGNLKNPFHRPVGTAQAHFQAMEFRSTDVDDVLIELIGKGDQNTVQLTAKGPKVDLKGTARTTLGDDFFETRLEGIQGKISDTPVIVATANGDPFLKQKGPNFWLNPTTINLGEGKLFLHASRVDKVLKGELKTQGFSINVFDEVALNGSVNANLTLAGTDEAPIVAGKWAVSYPYFLATGPVEAHIMTIGGNLSYKNKFFAVNFKSDSPSGIFEGKFTLPINYDVESGARSLNHKAPIGGYIRSDMNFEALAPLVMPSNSIFSGSLKGQIDFVGTLGAPALSGALRLVDGHFEEALLGTIINNFNGTIEGKGKTLNFVNFKGFDPHGGSLGFSGSMGFKQDKGYVDLTLQIDNLALAKNESAEGNIHGQISAQGFLNEIHLTGGLSIPYFNIHFGDFLYKSPPTLKSRDIKRGMPLDVARTPLKKEKIFFGLKLHIDDQFYAQGFDMDTQWGGDLHLSGSNAKPLLEGALHLVDGTILVGDKTVRFDKGKLTFDKHPKFFPILDAQGSSVTNNFEGIVTVTGRSNDPLIRINSHPAVSQQELAQQFLLGSGYFFGRENRPMSTDDTPQVVNIPILGFFGFDTLILEKIDTHGSADSGIILRIGKYVTRKTQVLIEQGIGVHDSRLLLESDLTPKLNLEMDAYSGRDSTPDPNRRVEGGAGVGLIYRHDY